MLLVALPLTTARTPPIPARLTDMVCLTHWGTHAETQTQMVYWTPWIRAQALQIQARLTRTATVWAMRATTCWRPTCGCRSPGPPAQPPAVPTVPCTVPCCVLPPLVAPCPPLMLGAIYGPGQLPPSLATCSRAPSCTGPHQPDGGPAHSPALPPAPSLGRRGCPTPGSHLCVWGLGSRWHPRTVRARVCRHRPGASAPCLATASLVPTRC